uniref:Uncharacterized protein n=1 Tax=Arundo donax TaxID=35708 RepID=A0A0A8Y9W7_ARUDO
MRRLSGQRKRASRPQQAATKG